MLLVWVQSKHIHANPLPRSLSTACRQHEAVTAIIPSVVSAACHMINRQEHSLATAVGYGGAAAHAKRPPGSAGGVPVCMLCTTEQSSTFDIPPLFPCCRSAFKAIIYMQPPSHALSGHAIWYKYLFLFIKFSARSTDAIHAV